MNSNLKSLLADVFGVSAELLNLDSSPETLREWDSLATVNLLTELESTYGCTFTMAEIVRLQNFRAIEQLLREKGLLK